mmetsp:Transcript_10929/g.18120  ORF Transcript_10929/g.18120 Transcript_10929/m.18120 type:complete len:446 (+) Transcript_10929:128-1465(+)|eukprot:CAMPEP_0119015880 /NCGR_PEP_ID=MMETSP1176-20130426/11701_1 /TAXON_ID=265551 /ORGANISM="Synedropsis recta cf, Strain CCMP1620" /LENGTH=445 /DNA_ID=CAMNT_0006969205 /DNA_START=87 /DNA_END=1424 /DNA_ORIENTATION=-
MASPASASTPTTAAATTEPHVVIAGAGPAGLLSAILLSQAGISVTILEKSPVADPWSTGKSYSINLNDRGLTALDCAAGVLENIKSAGLARHQIVLESFDGKRQHIPKNPPHYAVTRPGLVKCLENIAKEKHADRVTIQRGVEVTHIAALTATNGDDNNASTTATEMVVTLNNGSKVSCTHVIGADGKWSAVRNAIPDLKDQFKVQSEAAFGICITPIVSPERWEKDATSVFRPYNSKYYILAAPLPNGSFSVSAVCFEEIKEDHPWLLPPGENHQEEESWDAEYGARIATSISDEVFQERMAKMLQADLPFFYKDIQGRESLSTVRVNRRTSWLKLVSDDKNPNYSDRTGRVALIGDACHAMTPAIGEGCNCALESAVCLVQSLLQVSDQTQQATDKETDNKITVDELTKAFLHYGTTRPPQVVPIQLKSAAINRYKVPAQTAK